MNKEKGDNYEKFVLNYLLSIEKYDYVWLWKDIPEKILFEENIITDYMNYSFARNDIGIDILAKKNDNYTYVQCKNFANSVCVHDLSGYFFFKSTYVYKKKCQVYYNGHLSNRIKCMHPNDNEFINLHFTNIKSISPIANNNTRVFEIRDYQQEALQLLKNKNRGVINIPCGLGKAPASGTSLLRMG